jgi:plastocyanin
LLPLNKEKKDSEGFGFMVRAVLMALVSLIGFAWPGQATPPQFQIIIESGSPYYIPASAKVPTGAPIRWDNPTASPHTITHDGCLTEEGPCAFDSGAINPNQSYTLPGLPPGKYPYHCRLHPIMRGVLTVTDPSPGASQT